MAATCALLLAPAGADAANGDLSFGSCTTTAAVTTGCTNLSGMTNAMSAAKQVVISPDGRFAYVGAANDAISRFWRNPATGVLTFLDCLTDYPAFIDGCTDISGSIASPLNQLEGIAISPDGGNLYAVSAGHDSIVRFNRDVSSGALTFGGCITTDGAAPPAGCLNIGGNSLDEAYAVAVSPDGTSVYVASRGRDAVARFTRFPSGSLAWAGCVTAGDFPASGCGAGNVSATTTSLASAGDLAISPDGKSVYVAAFASDAVAHLKRNPSSGAITFSDCVTAGDTPATGCGAGNDVSGSTDGLDGANAVAVGKDGTSVYASGVSKDAIVHLTRNGSSGALGFAGCLTAGDIPAGGCSDLGATTNSLNYPYALSVAPDDGSLYVAGGGNTVANLSRDGATGSLAFTSCLWDGTPATVIGCAQPPVVTNAFDLPSSLDVGPEATTVYLTASNQQAVIQFHRQVIPSCEGTSASIKGGLPTAVTLRCTDANGEALFRSIVSRPAHGRLAQVNQGAGTVVYTPRSGYRGADAFSFRASDGLDDSSTATASLSVSPDVTPPVISRLRTRPRVFAVRGANSSSAKRKRRKRSTRFSYTLSEAARVVFTIERRTKGRKVGRRCRRQTAGNRHRRSCRLYGRRGKLIQSGGLGTNTKRFSGRLRGRKLRSGHYRARLRATDAVGNRSKRKSVGFRIVRR